MLMAREKASIFLSTSVALQGVRAAGAPSGCTDRDIGRRIQGMSDTVSSHDFPTLQHLDVQSVFCSS